MNEEKFQPLKAHWDELLETGQKISFSKGQVLFYEGHSPYGIFVLKSGKVRFSVGEKPCPVDHLWKAPKGNGIGLHHFFDQTPFCCTCIALTDCKMVFISKTQLSALFSRPFYDRKDLPGARE